MTPPWSLQDGHLTLYCHLQPGAKQDQLCGLYNQRLKIQLKAPPVDGKANKALVKYLSGLFNIAKSKILIQKGFNQRSKTILVQEIQELPAVLQQMELK